MATLHSDLFLDGDTAERDDPASVITITGVSSLRTLRVQKRVA